MWKQLLVVTMRNLKTFCGGLLHVKIISVILGKADHKVEPNRDINNSISLAVIYLLFNHFHI